MRSIEIPGEGQSPSQYQRRGAGAPGEVMQHHMFIEQHH
jgi:hypothetical protein